MAPPIEGDGALMTAFLQKEPDATRQLYDRFASRIFGLGLVLFRNRTDAEDLVQDTFLKIWRTGSAFDPVRGPLDAWILLSARSLALDQGGGGAPGDPPRNGQESRPCRYRRAPEGLPEG